MIINDMDRKIPNFVQIEGQVLADSRLSDSEKILYSYICLLTSYENISCYANNKFLAKVMGVSDRQIQNYLSRLKECDYISVEIKDNYKRKITPTINLFLERRKRRALENQTQEDLFDFDWLEQEKSEQDE